MEPNILEALRTIGAESVRARGLANPKGGNLSGFAGARRRIAAACCFLAAAMLGLMGLPAGAADLPVDLELVLAVDASPSIGIAEFFIQRRGYVAAFRDPRLIDAIRAGHYGRIAVTLSSGRARPASAWSSRGCSLTALKAPPASPRCSKRHGATSGWARRSPAPLPMPTTPSATTVLPVSAVRSTFPATGPNSVGPPIVPIRDAIVARGVTINGLPLVLTPGQASLDNYYRHCVIGGLGAFVVTVLRPGGLRGGDPCQTHPGGRRPVDRGGGAGAPCQRRRRPL